MGKQTKLWRDLLGILKDKASLVKAALSIKRASSSVNVAVIRATTHVTTSSPAERHLAGVLAFGHGSRPTACACVSAIMDRLHGTRDAYVALKCLVTLHHVITRGSFILKDQLSYYPLAGGRNFLNLSKFRDNRDAETWEYSSWVRWYATVLESNLIASRVLGVYNFNPNSKDESIATSLLNSDLLKEIDVLICLVEEICKSPNSLDFQRNNLVYEVVNLVGEDYRSSQHQIRIRLSELGERVSGLSSGQLSELTRCLRRLEECRERLLVLFANRKRNDAFWDLVWETNAKIAVEERERERWMVTLEKESTRFEERVVRPSQLLMLPYEGEWLGDDRVHLMTISPAMA